METKKLNLKSRIEQELKLRYEFGYVEADLNRLRSEAETSLFTYEDILQMELHDLQLRKLNGYNNGKS